MKKRRKLRNWVKYTLVGINFISILVMGGDSDNIAVFMLTHFIALAVFLLSAYILLKNMEE